MNYLWVHPDQGHYCTNDIVINIHVSQWCTQCRHSFSHFRVNLWDLQDSLDKGLSKTSHDLLFHPNMCSFLIHKGMTFPVHTHLHTDTHTYTHTLTQTNKNTRTLTQSFTHTTGCEPFSVSLHGILILNPFCKSDLECCPLSIPTLVLCHSERKYNHFTSFYEQAT